MHEILAKIFLEQKRSAYSEKFRNVKLLTFFGLGHGVVAAAAPRVAAQDAADGQPKAFERSVLLDGFLGIL